MIKALIQWRKNTLESQKKANAPVVRQPGVLYGYVHPASLEEQARRRERAEKLAALSPEAREAFLQKEQDERAAFVEESNRKAQAQRCVEELEEKAKVKEARDRAAKPKKSCTWPITLIGLVALPFSPHLGVACLATSWILGWLDSQKRNSENLERLRELAERQVTSPAPEWASQNCRNQ